MPEALPVDDYGEPLASLLRVQDGQLPHLLPLKEGADVGDNLENKTR